MNRGHPIRFRLLYLVIALLIVSMSFALNLPITSAQGANPWETPQGQACFERWITESMAKLNAYNGNAEFNGRKPWSINKYGVLEGRPGVGPTSVGAPDNFPQYNNNKYWWMWDAWVPSNADGTWRYPEWNGAGIENIRTYVTRCVGTSGTGSTNPPSAPSSPCDWSGTWKRNDEVFVWTQNGTQVTGKGVTDPSWTLSGTVSGNVLTGKWANSTNSGTVRIVMSADCNSFDSSWGLGDDSTTWTGNGVRTTAGGGGGTTQGGGITVPAIDNDSANMLWNCETNDVPFGDENYDKSRCFTFRYIVPSGGIQSAVLHLAINPLDPSTDALVFAVPTMHSNCTWTNDIPCVGWGEPIPSGVTSLDRDLTRFNPADAQAQILGELNKGVLHVLLQDDTTVYCAQLLLNGGDGTPLCTKENPGGGGTAAGQFILRTSKDVYATNEEITVDFSGLGAGAGNWITIAQASAKPENYGQWFWTDGKPSGTLKFSQHAAGSYEARLFLNWPSGGYNIAARYPFRVEGAGTGAMTLEAPRRLALPNDLLLIPVTLRNAANVANLNFDVQYDANVIRPEGNLLKGNLLDNALFSGNPAQAGIVRNGFAQTSGLSGTGTVVNIPFRIVGKPGEKSPLNLTVTTINDPGGGALTIERIHGEILITNSDGTLPGGGGGGGAGGGGGGMGGGGGGGGGIPRGDCDGDLRVSEVDALCALEMSVQLRAIQLIMDMDNSGDVTSRDAVIILQRAVGQ